MDWISIVNSLLAAAAVVLTAVINLRAERRKKLDAQTEEQKKQYIHCAMAMLAADMKLTEANTVAIQTGRTNGELAAALENQKIVYREYRDYLNSLGIEVLF